MSLIRHTKVHWNTHTKTTNNSNKTPNDYNAKTNIYDNEGTTINISPRLNSHQHKQVTELLLQFIHTFTTDYPKLNKATIQPREILMKPNYNDPKSGLGTFQLQ